MLKHLAKSENICYTYDKLSRVISKTVEKIATTVVSEETFSYDEAGNLTENYSEQGQNCFEYTSNNRLNSHNGYYVSYDRDGNITSVVLDGARRTLKYDSTNKLISAGQNAYTYNAENTRVKNLCGGIETSYVYDTNAKLSKLLVKKTGTTVTKYVYGRGLISEETNNSFKTYHFDYRGSTVALTNINGTITDTFEYDTYGKLTHRTGSTKILFMYNGRDGVVTDDNGLIYMRARYYSPELRRFVNADVLVGDIADSTSLNRYSYVNGDPVSYVDPFGLAKWWETALKIAAGVAVIATLAVVTVATAGTATAVIAGAAAAGATISGAASVVGGVVAGDSIDEIATSFMVGTVAGAASGALTASGAPGIAVTAGNLAIDVGEYVVEESIDGDDEEPTWGGAIATAAFSLAPDVLPQVDVKAKKLVPAQLEPGWLNKSSKYSKELARHNSVVEEYSKRANKKYADKQISRSLAKQNKFMSTHWDSYFRGLVFDEIKSPFYDPFQQKVGQFIDNHILAQSRK